MTQAGSGYTIAPRPPEGPLTARNLEDFTQCPRKFLLSHFSTRGHTQEFIGGPAALHRAVRAALVSMYSSPHPAECSLEALLETFEQHWDGSVCRDSREEEDLHRDGIAMLTRHHQEPIALDGERHADVRLEAEVGGHTLVAVADVTASAPPVLVRLTTARRPPVPGELPTDLSWGLLWLAGRGRFGDTPHQAVMVDLRKGRQVAYSLEEREQADLEARITDLAGRIRREREFTPVTGKYCRWCRSRRECPAWQRG